MSNSRFALDGFAFDSRFMRLFQALLDTYLDSPLLCQPLNSRFALRGLRGVELIYNCCFEFA